MGELFHSYPGTNYQIPPDLDLVVQSPLGAALHLPQEANIKEQYFQLVLYKKQKWMFSISVKNFKLITTYPFFQTVYYDLRIFPRQPSKECWNSHFNQEQYCNPYNTSINLKVPLIFFFTYPDIQNKIKTNKRASVTIFLRFQCFRIIYILYS